MIAERLVAAFLRRYARTEAKVVAPWIVGRRVLDLGAGEGWVAAALRPRGLHWVCSVDVGSFRRVPGPYVAYDGRRLPFRDDCFDTTLVLLALHHCAAPEAVLDEALRVTSHRLLIIESVYRNCLERFWLDHLDGALNGWRHGGAMAVPLVFRPPAGWEALFASRGLTPVATRWLGSWAERLVHHPLLYVLDRVPVPCPAS